MADFKTVIDQAAAYIEAHKSVAKPAIVLDIDETSLSNWEEIEQDDFGFLASGNCSLDQGVGCGDAAWELSARASAIKPTLELFKNAQLAKIDVFLITGRHERSDLREATEKNLRDVGYVGYTDLIMQPKLSATVRGFKTAARKEIQDKGYTIIANIGDQFSDLDESPGETQFHVPNPFYFLP
jgi:predicted secreted acid phosphatase